MESNLITLFALAFLGSIAGLIGGVIFLIRDSWAKTLSNYSVPFAAGVLLSVSLLHLLPESVEGMGEGAYLVVLISLLTSFFFEQFFCRIHHHEHSHAKISSSVPLIIVGDTIHNFIDGVAIASAFIINPQFGLVIAIASFLHETPHEIADFGVLIKSGLSKNKTFLINLFSASATFPGALLVYFFLRNADREIGMLLAISAGIFLYLGASDFLPEVAEEEKEISSWKKFMMLVMGVIVIYLLTLIVPKH